MNQDKYTNKNGYSCIPENRIVSSFKRFIHEKKKNTFPSPPSISSPSGKTPSTGIERKITKEEHIQNITYQSQIISSYYIVSQEDQNEFWENIEKSQEISQKLENLTEEEFYYEILKQISIFFGIQRDSENLQYFLMRKSVYAYNDCGYRIYIKNILRFDKEQHVAIGTLLKDDPNTCRSSDEEWVIKWNVRKDSGDLITESEFEKWKIIENNGAQIPKIISGFMILDFQVVVMEKLEPLDPSDYNSKFIVSILSYIEKLIPLGVNNNLKPSNILKRIEKDNTTYLVADVAMMTTTERDYGYQRFSWDPNWSSQVVDLDTITTVKNDLIEFGYILIWLSQGDEILNKESSDQITKNIRTISRSEIVSNWIARVKKINEQEIKLSDFIELKKLAMNFPRIVLSMDMCKRK
jgi:hypothetical protein